jgi:hypothetical protein
MDLVARLHARQAVDDLATQVQAGFGGAGHLHRPDHALESCYDIPISAVAIMNTPHADEM